MQFSNRLVHSLRSTNRKPHEYGFFMQFKASISSLKVAWRKDPKLDQAIENDKKWKQCARVVKEVLNEPGQASSIQCRWLHWKGELIIEDEEFTVN